MDYDANFIMQKSINWSLLNEGLIIPVSVCSYFRTWDLYEVTEQRLY